MDVDGNSYNDLLVGSFETQKVVVLRTRPIVNVTSTLAIILRGDSNTLDLDDRQCGDNACFDVEVCFTVEPTGVEGDAFQGRSVGESANKTVCVACIRVNPDFFPSFAIHCSYELYT